MRLAVWTMFAIGCGGARPTLECPSDLPGSNGFEQVKTYEHYDVDGETPGDFQKNATKKAPFDHDPNRPTAGNTESKLCYLAAFDGDDHECRVRALRVKHLVRITLPRWQHAKEIPAAYAEWEKSSFPRLAAHEEGHFAIADAGARRLYQEALTVTSGPTCEALTYRLQHISDTIAAEVAQKQAEYDAVTKHGTVDP